MAHDQEVAGSNPGAVYWMENCCNGILKKTGENKGSQMGQTAKKINSLFCITYATLKVLKYSLVLKST